MQISTTKKIGNDPTYTLHPQKEGQQNKCVQHRAGIDEVSTEPTAATVEIDVFDGYDNRRRGN